MKQTILHLVLRNRRTRNRMILNEVKCVVSTEFVALIAAHAPTQATGRQQFPVETMMRFHFRQQWFGLNDFAKEEALRRAAVSRIYHIGQHEPVAGLCQHPALSAPAGAVLADGAFLETVSEQLSAGGYLLKVRRRSMQHS